MKVLKFGYNHVAFPDNLADAIILAAMRGQILEAEKGWNDTEAVIKDSIFDISFHAGPIISECDVELREAEKRVAADAAELAQFRAEREAAMQAEAQGGSDADH